MAREVDELDRWTVVARGGERPLVGWVDVDEEEEAVASVWFAVVFSLSEQAALSKQPGRLIQRSTIKEQQEGRLSKAGRKLCSSGCRRRRRSVRVRRRTSGASLYQLRLASVIGLQRAVGNGQSGEQAVFYMVSRVPRLCDSGIVQDKVIWLGLACNCKIPGLLVGCCWLCHSQIFVRKAGATNNVPM